MDTSLSAAPEQIQPCQCQGEDSLPSALCHSTPGDSSSVGMWTWDAVGTVPGLIPRLVLVRGLAALLALVRLPHPSGFSHLLFCCPNLFSNI